jgi:DNA-directed RNA polymerase beta' subunit
MNKISKELDNIQFGIYSSDEIIKMSVCEVNTVKLSGHNSIYDKRMGVLEITEKCPTCQHNSKDCVGHFGHIPLNIYILHPLYYRLILSLLKCVCYKCSKLLLSQKKLMLLGIFGKISNLTKFNYIIKIMDKINYCECCDTSQPKYIFSTTEKQIYMVFKINGEIERIQMYENEIYKIFSNISSSDISLLGLDINNFHPKNLVLSVLPVLPPVSRPYVIADLLTCDDDLTLQYVEIIKANNHIGNNKTTDFKKSKYIQMLKFRIRSLFDNSGEKQKVSNGRPLKGIKKRLTGKEGIIRNNLMGKRVDKSARSVIGPDPTLKIDEIAIPKEIADILSYPITVNNINKNAIQNMIEKGKINFIIKKDGTKINAKYATTKLGTKILYGDVIFDGNQYNIISQESDIFNIKKDNRIYRNGIELQNICFNETKKIEVSIGDTVERKLKDNDILLLNRQPTLHRGSMIAQKVRIIPGKTIRLNLAITSSFNADFDGDEMNLFCPNNIETENELRMLSSVDNFIINPQSSKANIVIVQDTVLGIYKMTLSTQKELKKNIFWNCAYILGSNINDTIKKKQPYFKSFSGRFLFSLILPDDFFYTCKNDVDPNEPTLIIEHGILKSGSIQKKDLNKIISNLYLEYNVEVCKTFVNNVQFLACQFLLKTSFTIGISDCILNNNNIDHTVSKSLMKAKSIEETINNKILKEIYIKFSLGGARDVGLSLAKNSLSSTNNFISTVTSGARGDFFNIAQITGLLGQQNFCGGRIQETMTNCTRTLPHFPILEKDYTDDIKYESKGFIRNNFAKGLSPREFFLHSMTGREGITDTAMKTATSGYIQRRMIKVAEDVHIANDGTVRNLNNNIIQFSYGNNHLNSSHSIVKNNNIIAMDVTRLVQKLNYNHEITINK